MIVLTLLFVQTNVQGTFLAARAFLPTADPSHASILGVTTDTSLFPATYLPGLSSYVSSKLAQAKIYEFLAAENPNIFIATINPGMVATDNFYRTGATPDKVPIDTGKDSSYFEMTHRLLTELTISSPTPSSLFGVDGKSRSCVS